MLLDNKSRSHGSLAYAKGLSPSIHSSASALFSFSLPPSAATQQLLDLVALVSDGKSPCFRLSCRAPPPTHIRYYLILSIDRLWHILAYKHCLIRRVATYVKIARSKASCHRCLSDTGGSPFDYSLPDLSSTSQICIFQCHTKLISARIG